MKSLQRKDIILKTNERPYFDTYDFRNFVNIMFSIVPN